MKSKSVLNKFYTDIAALLYALYHPLVPWYSKLLIILTVAYAFSPIDLIPDFIPILGYLDDAIVLPFFILLAIRSIPSHVFQECRQHTSNVFKKTLRFSIIGIVLILSFWIFAAWIIYAIIRYLVL